MCCAACARARPEAPEPPRRLPAPRQGGQRVMTRSRVAERAPQQPSARCGGARGSKSRGSCWSVGRRAPAQLRRALGHGRRRRVVVAPRACSALASTCSNSTTRPPRSPVASCAPVASNSTAEMMSAAGAGGADASAHRATAHNVAPGRAGSIHVSAPQNSPHARQAALRHAAASAQAPAARRVRVAAPARTSTRLAAARGQLAAGPIRAGVLRERRAPSWTSSPGVRSPNTWPKRQSSAAAPAAAPPPPDGPASASIAQAHGPRGAAPLSASCSCPQRPGGPSRRPCAAAAASRRRKKRHPCAGSQKRRNDAQRRRRRHTSEELPKRYTPAQRARTATRFWRRALFHFRASCLCWRSRRARRPWRR